jgi:peptide deformylase
MAIRQILQLGNSRLYQESQPVLKTEIELIGSVVMDLHDTLLDFRKQYGAGRAIAAPQIGVMKRIIYMFVDGISTVFINPQLDEKSEEMMVLWDDCLCFPDLLVKVLRHKSCRIRYRNRNGEEEFMDLQGDLSELLQHEYDHLDGILAVSRAIDGKSFALKSQREFIEAGWGK